MCDFCENIGIGIPCLNFSDQDEPNWIRSGEYIGIRQILNRKALVFTNSADEYGYGALDINFCPICGQKLEGRMKELINSPKHYNIEGRKECIVEMLEKYGFYATAHFALLSAYKYLYRAGEKEGNPVEQEERKAQWYFDWVTDKGHELQKFGVFDWTIYWDLFNLIQERKRLPWVTVGYLEDDCK